jgi:hypothetical protein
MFQKQQEKLVAVTEYEAWAYSAKNS